MTISLYSIKRDNTHIVIEIGIYLLCFITNFLHAEFRSQNFRLHIMYSVLQICTWPSYILVLLFLFSYRHQPLLVQHPFHKHRVSDRDVFIVISNEG